MAQEQASASVSQPLTTRALVAGDRVQAHVLENEAFGYDPDPDEPFPPAGTSDFGSFTEDGRLVARAAGRVHRSWFRGVCLPTCGIADVTTHAESRGGGSLTAPLQAVLAQARERGAAVSTMYPTAPGIYRGLGYELVGSYDVVELPTATASMVRAPEGVTLRRCGLADMPAVRALYTAWAVHQNGPLERPAGTDEALLGAFTATTLALAPDGEPIGFASWNRGKGYDAATVLEVRDLFGTEPAVRALWRMLGSFSSVAARLQLKTSASADLARLVLPAKAWTVVESRPYALRVDDVVGAFAVVPVSSALAAAEVSLSVAGDRLGDTDGSYSLSLTPGSPVVCARSATAAGPVLTPNGLSLMWAGVTTCARLRIAGQLSGPTSYDAILDALLLGPAIEIRDYF